MMTKSGGRAGDVPHLSPNPEPVSAPVRPHAGQGAADLPCRATDCTGVPPRYKDGKHDDGGAQLGVSGPYRSASHRRVVEDNL